MRNYKTSEEQRERMLSYYYSHKQQILEQKRKERTIIRQHKKEEQQRLKQHQYNSNLIEMYQDWSLSLIEKLENEKHPKWIRRGILHMIMQLDDRINELEQHGETNNKR